MFLISEWEKLEKYVARIKFILIIFITCWERQTIIKTYKKNNNTQWIVKRKPDELLKDPQDLTYDDHHLGHIIMCVLLAQCYYFIIIIYLWFHCIATLYCNTLDFNYVSPVVARFFNLSYINYKCDPAGWGRSVVK